MTVTLSADDPFAALVAGAMATYALATLAAGALARAGFPLPDARRRIGCVDGLRGYLALSVMVHHFAIWLRVARLGGGWAPPPSNLLNNLGLGAVALFFMATGLVFYPRVRAGWRRTSWPATYIARACRIMPLIVVSLALITVIIALRTGHRPDAGFPLAAVQWLTGWAEPPLLGEPDSGRLNAYVLWSLWYEWLFYLLLLPACAWGRDLIGTRLPGWVLPAGLLLLALAARRLLLLGGLASYLPLFLIGMLAFECQRHAAIARWCRSGWMALAAGAALALGMVRDATPYGVLQLPLFGVFFICVACGNDFAGLLRTRGALLLGECSYGIYLLHGTMLSLLFVEGAPALAPLPTGLLPAVLPLAGLALVGVTAAAHLLIERPAIRAGHRLAARLPGTRHLEAGCHGHS